MIFLNGVWVGAGLMKIGRQNSDPILKVAYGIMVYSYLPFKICNTRWHYSKYALEGGNIYTCIKHITLKI